MVYVLKVKLKDVGEEVERTIHIQTDTSFEVLGEAINEGFEWEGSHLHEFSIKGDRIGIVFGDQGLFEEVTDETQARLSDYLKKGDQFTYVYDLGDCWEHDITVEEKIEGDFKEDFRIKESVGEAPKEDNLDTLFWEEDEPDVIWTDLIEAAKDFKRRKPWNSYVDEQIIVLDAPWIDHFLFCSILGGGGSEFGMAIYIGEDGLDALEETLEGEMDPEEAAFSQRSILISFSDREELEPEDYALLKEYGYTFRGKKQWPMFRSFRPGYYPWFIDEEEAEIALFAMRKVMEVKRKNKTVPYFHEPLWYLKQGDNESFLEKESYVESKEVPPIVSEIEGKRIRKEYDFLDMEVAAGTFHSGDPVQDGEERPFFPEIFVVIDAKTGVVLHSDIFRPSDKERKIQESFMQVMKRVGGLPAHVTIQVSETTYGLAVLLEQLGISYDMEIAVPGIKEIEQYMFQRGM